MGKNYPYSRKSMCANFPGSPHTMGFVGFSREPISQVFLIWWVFLHFSMLREIDEKTYGFPIWWSIPEGGNVMEKTINFMENVRKPISQAFPFWWVLLTFLMLWEIWWENPCGFHAMKYTIGWESNGKNILAPIIWKKYECQFPRFSTYNGFCRILPGTNFPSFPHSVSVAVFSHVMGNWWENTCLSHVMNHTMKWESTEKTASIPREKYEFFSPISQVLPIRWVLLHLPVLWKIDEETHAFPIWWSMPWNGNLMGK